MFSPIQSEAGFLFVFAVAMPTPSFENRRDVAFEIDPVRASRQRATAHEHRNQRKRLYVVHDVSNASLKKIVLL